MRAVALSDEEVQERIEEHFVPLKVVMQPGDAKLPLDWPGLRHWAVSYARMGGEKSEGFTCCTVISPDLETEYGSTGSAFVWELFDSIAYDPEKFAAMLDESLERATKEREIIEDKTLTSMQRERRLRAYRRQMEREISREGRFRLPPKGFTKESAVELFRISGDLP
ncbi:MAG: hypothetical protein AAF733_05580 [Verrucomicrobiota bacterium]